MRLCASAFLTRLSHYKQLAPFSARLHLPAIVGELASLGCAHSVAVRGLEMMSLQKKRANELPDTAQCHSLLAAGSMEEAKLS